MGRKAIFLDVDGTLTLPNGQVSERMVIMYFYVQVEIKQGFVH